MKMNFKMNFTVFLEFPDGYIFDIIQKMIMHRVKDFSRSSRDLSLHSSSGLITVEAEVNEFRGYTVPAACCVPV